MRGCLARFIVLVLLTAGCGSASTGTVNGEVTLDGKPLEKGTIQFVPTDGKGKPVLADITNGKFTARVPLGEAKVELSAPKVIGKQKMYDTPDSPVVENIAELLPPRYNVQSDIKLTVTRGTQEKKFEVTSK